jgi:hypothetical protein
MTINLRIQQYDVFGGGGNLSLTEEIHLPVPVTLEQAARVLTRFSELAKAVKEGSVL